MKALKKEPGRAWQRIEIDNELDAFQMAVGGYIECVPFSKPCACIICNEEGKLIGLPHNCLFDGYDFNGTILLFGVDVEDFTDLPESIAEAVLSGEAF